MIPHGAARGIPRHGAGAIKNAGQFGQINLGDHISEGGEIELENP
jgi:hypothetical protein